MSATLQLHQRLLGMKLVTHTARPGYALAALSYNTLVAIGILLFLTYALEALWLSVMYNSNEKTTLTPLGPATP